MVNKMHKVSMILNNYMVAVQIKFQGNLRLYLDVQTNVISCPLIRLSPQAVDTALPFRAK
jgi:hypothetical protein